jgi:hypothetical protein
MSLEDRQLQAALVASLNSNTQHAEGVCKSSVGEGEQTSLTLEEQHVQAALKASLAEDAPPEAIKSSSAAVESPKGSEAYFWHYNGLKTSCKKITRHSTLVLIDKVFRDNRGLR